MPNIMIDTMITCAVLGLNAFPTKNGISATMSPRNFIYGKTNLDFNQLKYQFGTYEQLYEGKTNTQKGRSIGAIALNPSNKNSGYRFMSLKTGQKLHGHVFQPLPIMDKVIDRVAELGEQDGHPIMENGPILEWSPGNLIIDDDNDDNVQDIQSQAYELNEHDENDYEIHNINEQEEESVNIDEDEFNSDQDEADNINQGIMITDEEDSEENVGKWEIY
jgi:hypothetical protein